MKTRRGTRGGAAVLHLSSAHPGNSGAGSRGPRPSRPAFPGTEAGPHPAHLRAAPSALPRRHNMERGEARRQHGGGSRGGGGGGGGGGEKPYGAAGREASEPGEPEEAARGRAAAARGHGERGRPRGGGGGGRCGRGWRRGGGAAPSRCPRCAAPRSVPVSPDPLRGGFFFFFPSSPPGLFPTVVPGPQKITIK